MSRKKNIAASYQAMFCSYPDALTPGQVKEMLGVGQKMTYRLLRNGRIQNVRAGRLYRIPKTAVIDYLCTSEEAENT